MARNRPPRPAPGRDGAKLFHVAPAKNDRPRATVEEYFADANAGEIVRRGELANLMHIHMVAHLYEKHTPWWSRIWIGLNKLWGHTLDPFADRRVRAAPKEE